MIGIIKQNKQKTIISIIVFLFFIGYFIPLSVQAVAIDHRQVELTDSRPSQVSAYDFKGDLSGSGIRCLRVDFCTTAGGICTEPTDLDTSSGSKAAESLWHDFNYTWWNYLSIDHNTFEIHASGLDNPGLDASWAIAGIVNSSLGGTHYARVNSYSDIGCSITVDSGAIAFVNISGMAVSVTIGGISNPAPVLISINPSSKVVGSAGFTMTLTGSDFISSSVTRFDGSDRSTTYVNSTTLTAEILESDLQTIGSYEMTVFNPTPGGGESGAVIFTVTGGGGGGGNPTPHLTSINPSSKNQGDPAFIMTLVGYDFVSNAVVRFAGSSRITTFLNSNTLQAEILSSDLEIVGDFNMTVFNPSPGGGESGPIVFHVLAIGKNLIPILSFLSPDSKNVGDDTFTMTLTGSDFISSSVVRFAGSDRSTSYINSTTLTAQIPSSDLQVAGDFKMTVFNPSPGGGESNPIVFHVLRISDNPIPSLDMINPSWKYVNSNAFTMTLTGSDFVSSSIVRFAGSDRSTTFINPTTLEAYILTSDLQTVGDFKITVFNPTPGGGESNALFFSVITLSGNPVPTLASIDPSWKYVNSNAFTMTLTGSDFISSSVVRFAGSDRSTSYINSTTLTAQIPSSDLQVAGDFKMTVFNPSPGGGISNPLIFSVLTSGEEHPGEGTAPEILEPLDGTYTNHREILIKGLAQANKQIDIFVNDQKITTVFSDQDGNFITTIILEEGTYFITAADKNKISNGVNLVVDLTPPDPPVLLEARVISQRILFGQINFSLLVQGKSSLDSVSIRAVINSEFVFSPEGEQWQKTFDLSLPSGQHQIYAFAYDLAGNISGPSNVLTFSIGLEIQPPINIIPSIILTPNLQEIIEIIKKIIDNSQIEKASEDTSKIVLPIATALSIGATASALASSGISLIQLLFAIYLLFIQPLVYIFSKKGKRGWGIVYNSLTKQPVDLAVIRLFDAKTYRLLATRVSDKEGRYIFVVDPGIYRMTISKQEYVFPSKILAEYKEDSRYFNLYHGQPIEVKEKNTVINVSIPLDPNKKFRSNAWLIRDNMAFSLKLAVPIAALILSFLSYVINPNIYLLLLFILNLLLFILIRSIRPRVKKDWGIVYDRQDKKPLNLTVVRIFDSIFDKLLDQQVTNSGGQYGFLVGGRKFYLTYNKYNYLEKVSQPIDLTKQEKEKIVGFDIYLERKKIENNKLLDKNQPDFLKNTGANLPDSKGQQKK